MFVRRIVQFVLVTILLNAVCSCSTIPVPDRSQTGETVTASAPQANLHAYHLESDLRALESSSAQMEQLVEDFQILASAAPWRANGYFNAEQENNIEGLLFSYLACRHVLWNLANYHKDHDNRFGDTASAETKAKSSAIAFNAAFRLILADASLVNAFHGDSVAINMLNEEFYRSRIPSGTYERLRLSVTNEKHLSVLSDSFLLYSEELKNPDSALASVVKQNPVYSNLVKSTETAAQSADTTIQEMIETESRIVPDFDNRLRHTRIAGLLRSAEGKTDELLTAARAHLFKGVSRIKEPEAHLIRFSADQKRQVYDALQPGDIILTFTAGYVSDIFIPGAFKHAITYVGSSQDRQDAGLSADHLTWLPATEREILLESVAVTTLSSGQQADVIEAVGEGVIFNHIGYIMDTHINRLLVLRPKISSEQRTQALANVFLFLGDEYDFKFDFADASKQVCTEVIYRAFDGKDTIRFSLVKRAGRETLSADDIVHNYLAAPGKSFDFVLFAEEAPDSKEHRAEILAGDDGAGRLIKLMAGLKD